MLPLLVARTFGWLGPMCPVARVSAGWDRSFPSSLQTAVKAFTHSLMHACALDLMSTLSLSQSFGVQAPAKALQQSWLHSNHNYLTTVLVNQSASSVTEHMSQT